jgi:AraC family transcriptional regulator
VYVSLATESSWSRTLEAVPHYCVAYCMHRPATITRVVSGERSSVNVNLRPRMLGIVPVDRDSDWQLRGSPDILTVYLRRCMVERVAADWLHTDSRRAELIPRLAFTDPMLEQLALQLLSAARSDDGSDDGLYADQVARLFAAHLLREHSTGVTRANAGAARGPTLPSGRMRHVRDLIESGLGGDLGLTRLAAEAGIGEHAFSVAFTRAFGVTPHRYVVQRRIERAKELLRGTDLPVIEVASETGFASQSHLATAFKRVVGVTPGAYREQASRPG